MANGYQHWKQSSNPVTSPGKVTGYKVRIYVWFVFGYPTATATEGHFALSNSPRALPRSLLTPPVLQFRWRLAQEINVTSTADGWAGLAADSQETLLDGSWASGFETQWWYAVGSFQSFQDSHGRTGRLPWGYSRFLYSTRFPQYFNLPPG
jgi:hypothetical protein